MESQEADVARIPNGLAFGARFFRNRGVFHVFNNKLSVKFSRTPCEWQNEAGCLELVNNVVIEALNEGWCPNFKSVSGGLKNGLGLTSRLVAKLARKVDENFVVQFGDGAHKNLVGEFGDAASFKAQHNDAAGGFAMELNDTGKLS